jgi:hypothetical protein
MPLEIKELHIKVSVHQPNKGNQPAAAPGKSPGADKDAVIAECVEQAIRIINDKKER